MSKEHQLVVGKNAMQKMYEHFERHLFSTYPYLLGKLFSRGVLGKKLMLRIRYNSDPCQALHLLLDHLCEQDSEKLRILVQVLRESGREECQPWHTLLADQLEHHLNGAEKDAAVATQSTTQGRTHGLGDSVNIKSEPYPISSPDAEEDAVVTSQNTTQDRSHGFSDVDNINSEAFPISLPTSLEATTEQSSTIVYGVESLAPCEYTKLTSSSLFKLEEFKDKAATSARRVLMTPTPAKSAHPCPGMSLKRIAGPNSTCPPTPLQATLEPLSSTSNEAESHTVCEYPELVSSLLYFFDDTLEENKATMPTSRDLTTPTPAKSAHPCPEMSLIRFEGPLKGRTHGDLVILLWRLGGSNPTKSNLAYQLIRGKKQQLPIDLQIINVLGTVYATPDNAHLFQEALEWTKRPDCMNPVYLQCRLNYLLSICTLGSDKDLSQQYLKQAQELSVMCEPDYTTALLTMQEARTILLQVEDHPGHLDEEALIQIIRYSDRACEISRSLPDWMQPFAMVVSLLKMQLDARIALLLSKSGNRLGAIAAVSPISHLLRDVEKPDTLCRLIPRQRALYHYIKTIISAIKGDREAAMTNAKKGRNLYLKIDSAEGADKIMEIASDSSV